jgi:hypothetical protein
VNDGATRDGHDGHETTTILIKSEIRKIVNSEKNSENSQREVTVPNYTLLVHIIYILLFKSERIKYSNFYTKHTSYSKYSVR